MRFLHPKSTIGMGAPVFSLLFASCTCAGVFSSNAGQAFQMKVDPPAPTHQARPSSIKMALVEVTRPRLKMNQSILNSH